MQRRNFLKTTGGAAASLSLTGCLGSLIGGDDRTGVTIGSDIPYRPFEYRNEDGELTGFDVDIAHTVFGDEMGLDVEFQETAWGSIKQDLQNNHFDVIMSAMTITEERAKQIDFSDPYFKAYQTIMIHEGGDIQSLDDLDGKTVAVQASTTGQDAARELYSDYNFNIDTYDDAPAVYEAFGNDQAHAVIADDLVNWQHMGDYDDATFLEGDGAAAAQNDPDAPPYYTLTVEEYGIGFRSDDDDFRAEVNEALAAVKEDGRYDDVYSKYTEQLPER